MGLKRGHRFPARFIGDALHLVSFDPGGSDDPAISLNGLRETLRGDVILFEQSMLFLAVHGTISMGQPSAAQVVSYHKCEIRHARPGSPRGVQDTNMNSLFTAMTMWFLVAQAALIAALIVGQIPLASDANVSLAPVARRPRASWGAGRHHA
jgi:hypothetical protein